MSTLGEQNPMVFFAARLLGGGVSSLTYQRRTSAVMTNNSIICPENTQDRWAWDLSAAAIPSYISTILSPVATYPTAL